jgi:protease I
MLLRFRQSVRRATLERRRRSMRGADIHQETHMERTMPPHAASLKGKKIAILATDGFEQSELLEPRRALGQAGAKTVVISLKPGSIRGWKSKHWGDEVAVDLTVNDADPDDFDALMLPGGVMNPDQLRRNPKAVSFVRSFFDNEKRVAAICQAPIMLIEANVLHDRHVTSWPSLQTDIRNAGGRWSDQEVVVDRGLVTSRKPDDIPAFNRKMIEEIAEGAASSRTDRSTVES